MEKKLLAWKIPRVPAIVITLLAAIALLVGLGMLVSSQTASLVGDLPTMQKHLETLWVSIQGIVKRTFHLNLQQQNQLLQKARASTLEDLGAILSRAVGTLTMSVASIFLVPIYVFFFLYYRDLLLRFIILLGVIGAVINMIPYIGGVIAVVMTILVAYADTGSVSKLFEVWVAQAAIQFIDNHLFVPYLIGSRVKLNALVSLVTIFIGFALCGIGGMFLGLPALAICKVIFDRVDSLRPWGLLPGDETVKWTPIPLPVRRRRTKKKSS